MCILLVKKLESVLLCARVNIVSGGNYPTAPLVTDNIFGYVGKYRGGDKILSPRGFNIAGASAPAVPTPLRPDRHCDIITR